MNKKIIVIGIAGYARCGKDTFCKIAASILKENGYEVKKLAFADELKKLADPMCKTLFNISAFTDDTEEKKVIRPGLVWIGCGMREHYDNDIWINKVNATLMEEEHLASDEEKSKKRVYLISDVRFPNEVDWVQNEWDGWSLHLSKFYKTVGLQGEIEQVFDKAPNEEERKNDPLVKEKCDFCLEWEDVRSSDPSILLEDIHKDNYLKNTVHLCLEKCPLIELQNSCLTSK